MNKPNKEKVKHVFDELEKKIVENYELLSVPLVHRFTDGLYVREMLAPSGCLISSKIHKVQHQFFVLKGKVITWDEDGNEQLIEAPYIGLTQAGTRRVLYVIEDLVWATCHPNPENKSLDDLEEDVVEMPNNKLLDKNQIDKILDYQKKCKEESILLNDTKN